MVNAGSAGTDENDYLSQNTEINPRSSEETKIESSSKHSFGVDFAVREQADKQESPDLPAIPSLTMPILSPTTVTSIYRQQIFPQQNDVVESIDKSRRNCE